ncbi:MAG: NADH:ubiquinone oxidoreductase subunit NDUFA12 [Alphaproteobacteria bacterium]
MVQSRQMSLVRRISQIGTLLDSWLYGARVGGDEFGNVYYRSRTTPKGKREKRWVIYAGEPEASTVPPDWHGWLHHIQPEPLSSDSPFRQKWQLPPQPNMTGTESAYFPPGHDSKGGHRAPATGDYQAWKPE